MRLSGWIPEEARRLPSSPIELHYLAVTARLPSDPDLLIREAAAGAGLQLLKGSAAAWSFAVPWKTQVYGLIAREIVETLSVELEADITQGIGLRLRCLPTATHNAHAVGLAGVLAFSMAGWLAGGLTGGIPVGLTALAGGWLWVTVTRHLALQRLELHLRHLADLMGSALWPGAPAQLLPPPRPLGR